MKGYRGTNLRFALGYGLLINLKTRADFQCLLHFLTFGWHVERDVLHVVLRESIYKATVVLHFSCCGVVRQLLIVGIDVATHLCTVRLEGHFILIP